MYKKILLAYDGSRESRTALREGALLAGRSGAEVVLLAIVPPLTSPDAMGAMMVTAKEHQAILDEGLERAKQIGLKVSGHIVAGEPIDAISAWAESTNADLVVVGHRKRSLLERWWSGPSHATLSEQLNCSLLICLNEISDEAFAAEAPPAP